MSQYRQIVKHADDLNAFRLLSIFSGVDYRTVINIDADKFDNRLFDVFQFVIENPLNVHGITEYPEVIEIGKRLIKIPSDPGRCSIGQKLNLQAAAREAIESGKPHCDLILYACAVYLQPVIQATVFDDEQIEVVMKIIDELPVMLVYPIGGFFLRGYIEYVKLNSQHSETPPLMKKLEQEPKISSKTSMSSTPSNSSQEATLPSSTAL